MNMIKRTSVGSSFSTPKTNKEEPRDRAAGLAGILPPRTSTPAAVVQETEPQTELVPEQGAAPDPHKPTKPRATAQNKGGGGVATIGVYLTPSTLERAREAALERRVTYTDLLVEAFDNVTDTQLAAEFAPAAPLIQGKAMPTRARRRRGTAGIQMNLRLSSEQREWLDAKVLNLGAPSRSALVAEALRLHLNPTV